CFRSRSKTTNPITLVIRQLKNFKRVTAPTLLFSSKQFFRYLSKALQKVDKKFTDFHTVNSKSAFIFLNLLDSLFYIFRSYNKLHLVMQIHPFYIALV
ncbi:hypothetical protein, partial [Staphylococcus pseudintermedius]|uniref:hypothetical protein n=1 Tax=Staphylococcus pseudintermedius TaxID=283734 RepID=UPI001A8C5A13